MPAILTPWKPKLHLTCSVKLALALCLDGCGHERPYYMLVYVFLQKRQGGLELLFLFKLSDVMPSVTRDSSPDGANGCSAASRVGTS